MRREISARFVDARTQDALCHLWTVRANSMAGEPPPDTPLTISWDEPDHQCDEMVQGNTWRYALGEYGWELWRKDMFYEPARGAHPHCEWCGKLLDEPERTCVNCSAEPNPAPIRHLQAAQCVGCKDASRWQPRSAPRQMCETCSVAYTTCRGAAPGDTSHDCWQPKPARGAHPHCEWCGKLLDEPERTCETCGNCPDDCGNTAVLGEPCASWGPDPYRGWRFAPR